MAYGRTYGRYGAAPRLSRYPSRRASTSLAAGRYARYRSMRGPRKLGFRGRFPGRRPTVSGNRAGMKRVGARTDFPAYVPRTVSLRQEQKFIEYPVVADSPWANAPFVKWGVAATSSINLLPLPSRGDALNARLADRILYNSLIIRGRIRVPTFTLAGEHPLYNVELFIIWDYSPQGSGPVIGDIFTIGSGTFDTTMTCGLMQRPDSRDRFALLYRYRYQLTGNLPLSASSSTSYNVEGDRVSVPIDLNLAINKVVAFTNTTTGASYSEIKRGAPLLLMVSDTTAVETCVPVFTGYVRGLFADL